MDTIDDNKSNDNCQSQSVAIVNTQSFACTASQIIHRNPDSSFHDSHLSGNSSIQQDLYAQWRRRQQERRTQLREEQQRIQESKWMCQLMRMNYWEYDDMCDEYQQMQL